MNEKFIKEAFKRLKEIGLTKKDLLIIEKASHKFLESELYDSNLNVYIEKDLGLIQFNKI
ncbi:hypothetical protein ACSXDV_12815 [Clostridium perfringens]